MGKGKHEDTYTHKDKTKKGLTVMLLICMAIAQLAPVTRSVRAIGDEQYPVKEVTSKESNTEISRNEPPIKNAYADIGKTETEEDNKLDLKDDKNNDARVEESQNELTETLPTEDEGDEGDEKASPQDTDKYRVNVEDNGNNPNQKISVLTSDNYVLESEDAFSWKQDGATHYQGNKPYVEVPHTMGGKDVTSYSTMFRETSVKGVKSTNTKVIGMDDMFTRAKSETLDVSQIDTRNVTSMRSMFTEVKAKELDLSTFNTGNVLQMNAMFRGASTEVIDISSFITAKVTNMERMFQDSNIKTIDITHFDTAKVQTMAGMFSGSKASTINVKGINTKKVADMKEMFKGAGSEKLDLSSFDTTLVTNMRDMFQNNKAKELNLTSFNTTNVTDMSNMFNGSEALELNLTSFNTENVYDMANIFQNSHAQDLDLGNFNTSRITSMSGMFSGAKASNINVRSFDTTYVTDMGEMFMDTHVKELDLSSFYMGNVNNTDDMFKGTTATKGYARTKEDADILNNSKGKPTNLHFETRYVVPEDKDFIGSTNGAFKYIGKDEYIEIPHVIKEIPVVSYKGMFENTSVKGVVSTNKKVTDMTRMFMGNTSESLDISNLDTSGAVTMGSMFEDANTTNLKLTNFDTSRVVYMGYMFKGSKVPELELSSFNMVNVTNTEGMFENTESTRGYARTKEDAGKLNTSSKKPDKLNFTVRSVLVESDKTDWTNESVNLTVKGESELSEVDYIDLVSNDYAGRNLIRNSNFQEGKNYWYTSTRVTAVTDEEGIHITTPEDSSWPRLNLSSPIFNNMKKGETYTLSFDAKGDNSQSRTIQIAFSNSLSRIMTATASEYTEDWKKNVITFTTTGDSLSGGDFNLQVWVGDHKSKVPQKRSFRNFKLERGDKATPFSLAPEDVKLVNNQKDYQISENGTYIFRLVDKKGNTKEVAHTVSNIDYNKPTATLISSPNGWTSSDVSIYVNASDDLSGVDYITLPDGTEVNGSNAEYKVNENKTYTFKVTDKAGNTETFTKEISNIDKDVPELYATVQNKAWTRDTVNIEVESKESLSGLTDIQMISSPEEGRNYLKDSNIDIRKTRDTDFKDEANDTQVRNIVEGIDIHKTFYGKPTTLTFYINSKGKREENPRVPSWGGNRFGIHSTASWVDSKGVLKNETGYPSSSLLELEKWGGRVRETSTLVYKGYDTLADLKIAIQPFGKPAKDNDETWVLKDVKLEVGKVDTPWTPAPEDIKLINNKKVYPVASNGLYTFKATYNNGKTSEASVNVTNIDRTPPEVKVTGNIEDWTKDDDITLTINATDTQSGVKSITLPDKKVVNGNKATFKVTKNDAYTFTVEDNVGNKTTHTETIDRLMVPYTFYIYDSNGKPLKGFEYDLLRDGQVHSKAVSDANGLVDFGKVPATGKYTIKQTKAPDGYVVNPDEKEVEVGDTTEPDEFVGYPRGDELPGTGTSSTLIYIVIVLGVVTCTVYVRSKKSKVD